VLACHDLSEGGLAVAAAEMAIGSGLGLEIDLGEVPATRPALPEATILFAESPSRFLVEVAPESAAAFEERVRTLPHARVGQVLAEPVLRVAGREGMVIEAEVARLKACWQAPLQEAMP
jgi:phosphoribosylformylglycinamidine synthase